MHAFSDPSPNQAMCAKHPIAEATFTCSRCGAFSCGACERYTNDAMRVCDACIPLDRSFVLAERMQRFIANMIDGFIFGAAIIPSTVGVIILSESTPVGLAVLFVGLLILGWFAVVQIGHARSGRSIGKKGQGIRVVRSDGSPASLWRILILRNLIISAIGSVVGLVSLVDSLLIFGERRRCLHDYLADTVVIIDQGDD